MRSACGRDQFERYPHELSGGQRQRAVLARALVTGTRIFWSATSRSRRSTSRSRRRSSTCCSTCRSGTGLAYLFISHDLRVVRQVSDACRGDVSRPHRRTGRRRTAVRSPAASLYAGAGLGDPDPGPATRGERIVLQGDPPNPVDAPAGCAFHPRCQPSRAAAGTEAPVLSSVDARPRRCLPSCP